MNLVSVHMGETGSTQKNLSSFAYGRKKDEERGKNLLHFTDHKRLPSGVTFHQNSKYLNAFKRFVRSILSFLSSELTFPLTN